MQTTQTLTRRRRIAGGLGLVVVVIVGAAVWGEHEGWPWLVQPASKFVGGALNRSVTLAGGEGGSRPRIQLWGGVSLHAPEVTIGAPTWSADPFTLKAKQGEVQLAYGDLWSAYRGHPLRIKLLQAQEAQAFLAREASGRNSWTFGPDREKADKPPSRGIQFGTLNVETGQLTFNDALLDVNFLAEASVHMGEQMSAASREPGFKALIVKAKGQYKKSPMVANLNSSADAPGGYFGAKAEPQQWPVILDVKVGQAHLKFKGGIDPWGANTLRGRFSTNGPSLAAAGEPFGVTLPTTGPFDLNGFLSQTGERTAVVVSQASLGTSRLGGEFIYDRSGDKPLLAGRLRGSRLALADLGPAIGVPEEKPKAGPGDRVLPDRSFDLPSLAAMNANVVIDIGLFDVGKGFLKPLAPLKGHLVLKDALLSITDLSASTAGGQVMGKLSLDGRKQNTALWKADLSWKNVQLDDWIPALRPAGRVPYATGQVDGRVVVAGQGKSTAAILGSLDGTIQARLRDGTLSHLGVELAGVDLAQGLGILLKGDEVLPVPCGRADVVAKNGVLKPDLFLLTTRDSTVWAEGTVSLVDEKLALQAKVAPKDFSLLTLRTPIQVTGTLGEPHVSIEVGKLLPRVAGAIALGALMPVAAIVPFIDTGNKELARKGDELCRQEQLNLLPKRS